MTPDVAPDGHLVLAGGLTIRTTEVVCSRLLETLTQHARVTVDCSAATEVDLSFIQLLIAARTSAAALQKTVVLESCPDGALLETLTRGGFRVATEDASDKATTFWFEGAEA